jgi:GT2 family glycosyltransferase
MARVAKRLVPLMSGTAVRAVPGICVVVPNWNGAAHLGPCIRSLAAQDHDDFEIVVVDNGSVDDSVAMLDRLAAEIAPVPLMVLRNDVNRGFAGGVNRGIRHALDSGASAVALFNNDAVADAGWLSALAAVLDADPDVAIATGRLLMRDGLSVDSTGDFYSIWGLAFPRDRDRPAEPVRESGDVFAASGGASLYRLSLFADIGVFDEEFFAYFEDVDLSFRARLAGYRISYCADAVAFHDQGATSRTMSGFATTQFFRNLPLLLVKNVPARLLPTIVPRFVFVYSLMVVHQFRRGQGVPALRGVWQSIALAVGGLPRRRAIQRSRRVDAATVRQLLWPTLPPGMRVLRGIRDRLAQVARVVADARP